MARASASWSPTRRFYADDCYVVEKTYFRHGRWHTRLVQVCD